jgi:peroxiredoxin
MAREGAGGELLGDLVRAVSAKRCRDSSISQKEFGSKGLQFVGIAVDEGPKVRQFADELKLNYPALIGGYGAMELSRTLGNKVMALPFTVIVGRDGKIAHTQLGPLKSDQLRGIITQLI